MHLVGVRLNTLLTLAAFLLAILCTLASFFSPRPSPTNNFNSTSSSAVVEVLKVHRIGQQLNGNDEVTLTLNISLDLRPAFTWNTKQVFVFVAAEYQTVKNSLNQMFLWDHIIQEKEHAKLQTQTLTKYPLVDQGSHLRGKQIKLVLHWYIMPIVGRTVEDKRAMSDFRLPEAYT